MKGAVAEFVEEKIRAICEWKRVEVLELNVREDHVHAVVVVPPRLAVSELTWIFTLLGFDNPQAASAASRASGKRGTIRSSR